MNVTQRAAGPTIAAALAYFTVKMVTPQMEWLNPSDQVEAVAMATILYTHLILEARELIAWVKTRWQK